VLPDFNRVVVAVDPSSARTMSGFSNPFYSLPLWAHLWSDSPWTLLAWFGTYLASLFNHLTPNGRMPSLADLDK
jgi:hypothetical protein